MNGRAPVAVVMLAGCGTGIDAEPVAPPGLVELTVHAARRCPHCGWIESKRQIASSVADPQSLGIYEYTLRMTDGSREHSGRRSPRAGAWENG